MRLLQPPSSSAVSPQVAALAGTVLSNVLLGLLAGPRRRSRLRAGLGYVVGAAAVGALAIGAVAISRLAIKSMRISRLQIDHLEVRQASGLPGGGTANPGV